MRQIFRQHKKLCIVLIGILCLALVAGYLYATFLPGIWHGDAFLYDQGQGVFAGSDRYADYRMEMLSEDGQTNIVFAVNDTSKSYQIIHEPDSSNLQLFEDGNMVFDGKAYPMGDGYMFENSNGEILFDMTARTEYDAPDLQELYPSYARLCSWVLEEKHDFRGSPVMIVVIVLLAVVLGLDIVFPDLFFILEHRLDVDGGEPSDWYRMTQKISRVAFGIGIVVCIILSFTMH